MGRCLPGPRRLERASVLDVTDRFGGDP